LKVSLLCYFVIILFRKIENGYDWIETVYKETPTMSTYLLAVVISDYECKSETAKPSASRSISIRVCARSNAQDELDLALEASKKVSEFFEQYYGIEYPLSKLGKYY
jgi:aminopeptidase N